MTMSIDKINLYAKARGTTVLAHRIHDDYKSATFVLESGQKLTMTEAELDAAIEEYNDDKAIKDAVANAEKTIHEEIEEAKVKKVKSAKKGKS